MDVITLASRKGGAGKSTLTAQLAIDGQAATYRSTGFSLGGRVGARVQLRQLFIQLAVEAMGVGPLRVGGSLLAGLLFS